LQSVHEAEAEADEHKRIPFPDFKTPHEAVGAAVMQPRKVENPKSSQTRVSNLRI
jgi:hypothetical protein